MTPQTLCREIVVTAMNDGALGLAAADQITWPLRHGPGAPEQEQEGCKLDCPTPDRRSC